MATRAEALQHLRQAMAIPTLEFRDGQWEAIDHIVNQRGKVLCVQRTGWGKSMVYFVSAKLMRGEGAGATVIISPLLANVVLNELDHWVDSQWVEHPLANRYGTRRMIRTSEVFDKSKGYCKMRKTNLKEMFIVRYADDFKILCRDYKTAKKIFIAVKEWLWERLGLEISPEKSKITNVRKKKTDFLGFA